MNKIVSGHTYTAFHTRLTLLPLDTSDGVVSISASTSPPGTVTIRASGLSYTLAELGVQLAWIFAALQHSETKEVTRVSPQVQELSTKQSWDIRVHLTPTPINSSPGLLALKSLGWFDRFMSPIVVEGYPTLRRPPGFSGVELSAGALFAIVPHDTLQTWMALRLSRISQNTTLTTRRGGPRKPLQAQWRRATRHLWIQTCYPCQTPHRLLSSSKLLSNYQRF